LVIPNKICIFAIEKLKQLTNNTVMCLYKDKIVSNGWWYTEIPSGDYITSYKVLIINKRDGALLPPYQNNGFHYRKGELATSQVGFTDYSCLTRRYDMVGAGLHSYENKKDAYHLMRFLSRMNKDVRYGVFKCKIPHTKTFFRGRCGGGSNDPIGYVSDKLIVVKQDKCWLYEIKRIYQSLRKFFKEEEI